MEFSLNDVKTLKFIYREKLNYYINYLKKDPKIEKIPLEKVDDETKDLILAFDKNAKYKYQYTDEMLDIDSIFIHHQIHTDPNVDTLIKAYEILKEGWFEDLTPNMINYYITQVVSYDTLYPGLLAKNIEKPLFLNLLELLNDYLNDYDLHYQEYEDKYGKENLISDEEDCENAAKAGNVSCLTNPNWEEDWKEFIKHDHQWDGSFFYYLIVHKLKLIRKYYDPKDGKTILGEKSAKKVCKEVDKALELAKLMEDDEWIDEKVKDIDSNERYKKFNSIRKQTVRNFFIYLADHFENWWD